MPATTPNAPYVLIDGARILYAPLGTAKPSDNLALNAAWPVAWKEVGYTNEPAKLTASFEVYKVMVQQRQTFIYKKKVSSEVMLETRLVDLSADTLLMTLGGLKSTVAAGASQPPMDVYKYTDDDFIPANIWAVEGGYIFDADTVYPLRIYLFSASPSDGTDLEINREKEAGTALKLECASLSNGDVFEVRWVVGEPTS